MIVGQGVSALKKGGGDWNFRETMRHHLLCNFPKKCAKNNYF